MFWAKLVRDRSRTASGEKRTAIVGSAVIIAALVGDFACGEENFRGSSEIKGITVAAVSVLPAAPASAKKRESCMHLIEPETLAGQLVAAKGWAVTGEVKIGGYTAVSFVGRCDEGGSGTSVMTRGNIGIFSDKLLAIAYGHLEEFTEFWLFGGNSDSRREIT